jgi:hypothetical protein
VTVNDGLNGEGYRLEEQVDLHAFCMASHKNHECISAFF